MSPPSSSMAVKRGSILLTLKKKISRLSTPSAWGNFPVSPACSTRLTTECGPRSASSWVLRDLFWQLSREKLARLGHVTRHHSLSKTILQSSVRGWATPWSAEKMLDGLQQGVDIPAHFRTAHKGLVQKRLKEDLCWLVPHASRTTQSVKGLNWTDTLWVKTKLNKQTSYLYIIFVTTAEEKLWGKLSVWFKKCFWKCYRWSKAFESVATIVEELVWKRCYHTWKGGFDSVFTIVLETILRADIIGLTLFLSWDIFNQH